MTRSLPRAAATLALPLLLLACGADPTERELLDSAKALIAKSDASGARIQLQNALLKNPQSAEARLLLGKLLLDAGQPEQAEIELKKAQDLGAPADRLMPLLARATLQRHPPQKVIDQFGAVNLQDAAADAELKSAVVVALARTGQRPRAEALAKDVLARVPDSPHMLLTQARLQAASEGVDASLAAVKKVLELNPGLAEGWQFQGELLAFGKRDLDGAVTSFERWVALQPSSAYAHSTLVALHFARHDVAAARKQHAAMEKALPTALQTRYVDAQVTFAENNSLRARELVQAVLKAAPKDARLLQFAGTIEAQLNSPSQAAAYLNKALSLSPDLVTARRLLAKTNLRMGQDERALEVLRPLLGPESRDAEAFTLAAEAALAGGDLKAAELLFARAKALQPEDAKVRTALALTQLSKGQTEEGVAELKRIAAGDKDVVADLALISALLRRNDLDGALKAIAALAVKEPKNPRTPHMRGRVLLMKRDQAGARKSFEDALALDPAFFPATASLATLDYTSGKPDAARQRLEEVLKADPRHLQALISLADLGIRQKAPPASNAEWLNKAIAAHPGEATPRLMLVNLWLANGDRKQALEVAQAAVAAMPDQPALLDALGRAQVATGELNQAVATFAKLSTLKSSSPQPLLRLADAYRAARNDASAEQALKRALAVSPRNLDAQRGLIIMALRGKRVNDALAVARQVQKERPEEAVGYLLEGNIHAEAKSPDEAIKAYRRGLEKPEGRLLAIQIHETLLKQKRTPEAEQFVAEWLKKDPKDALFLFHLGNVALRAEDWAAAEKRYTQVVELQPNNPKALNNLAWLKVKTKQPDATAFAERAVALAPRDPRMLDTLALALGQSGQTARAIEVAKSAVTLSGNDAGLRLALARLHVAAGQKQQARELLEELAKLGDKFDKQPEVQKLLKEV